MRPPAKETWFAVEWPALARRVDALLRARGVPAQDRDDALQETALRLCRRWDSVDLERPMFPFAVTIALNVVRDQARAGTGAATSLEEAAEVAATADTEQTCLARIELERVGAAMARLTPVHRDLLLETVVDEGSSAGRQPAALKMRRHRARRRLATLLEAASCLVAGALVRLRRTPAGMEHVALALTAAAIVALPHTVGGVPAPQRRGPAVAARSGHVAFTRADRAHDTVAARPAHRDTLAPSAAGSPPAAAVQGADEEAVEPVRVELGNGHVEASASVDAGAVRAEVGDSGGPVPVCVEGPVAPDALRCR